LLVRRKVIGAKSCRGQQTMAEIDPVEEKKGASDQDLSSPEKGER